jgi:uncharacterized protein YecE (DUF72 family)
MTPVSDSPIDRGAWRARREERRAKQRAENVVRAKAMHIARLEHERNADAAREARSSINRAAVHDDPTALVPHVGCSGWYYWHWGGAFYPAHLPRAGWFEHYASRFSTVELNAPFYSWPTAATVATWKKQVGRRKFVYAIKVNELITHTKRFSRTATLIKDFGFIADLLGPRFGCFLFQLPPSFNYTSARLAAIVKQLDPKRRNVVEFRHASWWNDRVYAAFRECNAIFCSVSAPRLPDELVKTAGDVYIRFHGTKRWYRHDYTPEELAVWVERVHASGAQRVWAYFNNDREGYAIKNARELLRQLKSKRPQSTNDHR